MNMIIIMAGGWGRNMIKKLKEVGIGNIVQDVRMDCFLPPGRHCEQSEAIQTFLWGCLSAKFLLNGRACIR